MSFLSNETRCLLSNQRPISQLLVSAVAAFVVVASLVNSGCMKSGIRNPLAGNSASQQELSDDAAGDPPVASGQLTIWHESMEAAQRVSAETGKPILADFTGSDWCGWCIKLKEDVFEQPEFKAWARDNVVLLELDYPKRSRQSAEIRAQNQELAQRYQIQSYPTVLLLDTDGTVLGRMGYESSPATWITKLESQVMQQASVASAR